MMLPEDSIPLEVSSIGLLMCAVDTNPTQALHVVSLAQFKKVVLLTEWFWCKLTGV